MNRDTQLRVLDELLRLKARETTHLAEHTSTSPIERYTDSERFENELGQLYGGQPLMVAHHSELPGKGCFLSRDLPRMPLLLTRDDEGRVHAFVNVCRHRGARLVGEKSGCRSRFSCPYHAWTWDNRGRLRGVPQGDQGFPSLDKAQYGLKRLGCEERFGWVWLQPDPGKPLDVKSFLAGLETDFEWMAAETLEVFDVYERAWASNWKIIVEGGVETYHFRRAHRDTVYPLFNDNLSCYEVFGQHLRTAMARRKLEELAGLPRDQWALREYASILYTLLPSSSLLVQPDHLAWIESMPLSIDRTLVRVASLVPKAEGERSEKERNFWAANHRLTVDALNEDFALAESIQKGLASGANQHLTFGRFEGALDRLHRIIESSVSV